MNPDAPPAPAVPPPIVLPRPNLGPEPWGQLGPAWSVAELAVGALLALLILGLAAWKWRARRAAGRLTRGEAEPADQDCEPTPGHRLIASSAAVRAALIAQFGPSWGSRTSEEIAADPALVDRLGTVTAGAVVLYLDRVDRAKFAGEEVDQVDEWIGLAESLLGQIAAARVPSRRSP